jgi:hypothetical protein
MLRRKAKRAVELHEPKINEESKKKKAVIDVDSEDVEKDLEKLLFGEAKDLDIFSVQDKKPFVKKSDSDEVCLGLNNNN